MEGEVILRPLNLSDTDLVVSWRNTEAVRLKMYDQSILTVAQHRHYISEFVEKGIIIQYIIVSCETPVGTIFCRYKDKANAEMGIFIAPEHQKKGYGTNAINKFVELLRGTTSIIAIGLKVHKTNINAIKLYRKCGFIKTKDKVPAGFISMSLTIG